MDACEVRYHMENDIVNIINQGKTILMPVLAYGRAQENLFMLKSLQDRKELSKKIPIRLDGNMAQVFTKMFQNIKLGINPAKVEFLPENLTFITKEDRQSIIDSKQQQIILTTAGMCDFGPIQMYLPIYLQRKDVVIYFSNYVTPTSLGYRIQHPKKGKVKVGGVEYEVKSEVLTTNEQSGHAKADEIIDFLSNFKKLQLVLLNHGDKEVLEQFKLRIENEVKPKRTEILGEYAYRINEFGYKQHMKANLQSVRGKKTVKSKRTVPQKNKKKKVKVQKYRKYHK